MEVLLVDQEVLRSCDQAIVIEEGGRKGTHQGTLDERAAHLVQADVLVAVRVEDLEEAQRRVTRVLDVMAKRGGHEADVSSLIVEGSRVAARCEEGRAPVAFTVGPSQQSIAARQARHSQVIGPLVLGRVPVKFSADRCLSKVIQ